MDPQISGLIWSLYHNIESFVMDNTGYRGGGIMNFFGLLDVRVNPYALSRMDTA